MASFDSPTFANPVVLGIVVAVAVVLAGFAVLGCIVQRSRQRAEARLDEISSRVLQLAVVLSDQTRAGGHDARLRLIRTAHAAMTEQQARGKHRS